MTKDVIQKSKNNILPACSKAADLLVAGLIDWGVEIVFGLPGDGINGIMESLRKYKNKIRFIQVRHEESAALMACAYAKFTGKLGVCIATTGPGAIHLLNGLYDAKMDNAPVIAITGQTYHDLLGSFYQQEVDLINLFKDVTVYDQMITGAQQVKMVIDEACRFALSLKQVAHVTIPADIQNEPLEADKVSEKNVPDHTNAQFSIPITIPATDHLHQAAEILNNSNKIVILVGQGGLNCQKELEALANTLAAPIIKSLLGKAAIPDDSPLTTGGIGLLGSLASEKLMKECDTLFIIGCNFPYMEYYPKIGQALAIQIDSRPERLGLRYPLAVGLTGNAKETLQALLPMLNQNKHRAFLSKAQQYKKEWQDELAKRAVSTNTLKPQTVVKLLDQFLDENAIITSDSGSNTFWAAQYVQIKKQQMFNNTGLLATMAAGLPYIIAAKLAFPQRQCVAVVGDGGFTMLMCEFLTAVKYHLPIIVVIIKNKALQMIKMEQAVMLGNPPYGIELQDMDFVKFAESCGGAGAYCENVDDVNHALKNAIKTKIPFIVEALVDQDELPLPPLLTEKQKKNIEKVFTKIAKEVSE